MMVNEICEKKYNKPLSGCTNEEIYYALLDMTKDLAAKKESEAGKKKVYYISAEFLIGKLLSNNLINLGLYKTVKKELEAAGITCEVSQTQDNGSDVTIQPLFGPALVPPNTASGKIIQMPQRKII